MSEKRQRLQDGLRNERAIEWVGMVARQLRHVRGMCSHERQVFEAGSVGSLDQRGYLDWN